MLRIFSQKTTEQVSDEALLAQYVSEGSARHLGLLYERYMGMVYGVCLKILKDPGKAEDAVMGIYEELTVKVKDHKIEAFRGWLYVLSRNYCLMEYRKHNRKPIYYQAPENMEKFDAIEEAFEFELPQKSLPVQECIDKLNEIQKQCVLWFYYEDKSYKDIADILKEELGKVRSYIQNGKRNLRLCLERS
jgi:RNA polymerase sigma factor (sigma-70 family)